MVDRSVAEEVRRRKLTYLTPDKFDSLYECIDEFKNRKRLEISPSLALPLAVPEYALQRRSTANNDMWDLTYSA